MCWVILDLHLLQWKNGLLNLTASLKDNPHTVRLKSATTPEIINKVHDIVLEDRRLKVYEIAKTEDLR